MVLAGVRLMFSAPLRSFEDVPRVGEAGPGEAGDEVPDFGQGERYEAFRSGSGAPFLALTVVRKAWASMDRVMWRYQPVYWRTW